jgi:predicted anti-sigma-YlaC factor YlaD
VINSQSISESAGREDWYLFSYGRTMDCEEIISLISRYIDDDIDILMRDMLEEHLQECERCLSLLHTLEKTIYFSREVNKPKKVPKKVMNRVYYEIRIRYKK